MFEVLTENVFMIVTLLIVFAVAVFLFTTWFAPVPDQLNFIKGILGFFR